MPAFPVRRYRRSCLHLAACMLSGGGLAFGLTSASHADPAPVNFTGIPEQVIPTYAEVGLGNYTPPATGTGTTPTTSSGGTSTTGGGTTTTSSDLTVMESQSWGYEAEQNASALGVNPDAVAATCVMESGCQNVTGSGTIAGAFQMTAATYNSTLAEALAANPSLADNIVTGTAGQMDPATESIAAAQYLKDGASTLENAGVSDPTVLQVRGIYNFGPVGGTALAEADDTAPVATVLSGVDANTLAANGITAGETVGEWRASVSSKIGSTAGEPVLSS